MPLRPRRPLARRRAAPSAAAPAAAAERPTYIYPGLLRLSPERAAAVDAMCPASRAPAAADHADHAGPVCAVCCDELRPHDLVRTVLCGHAYHSACLLAWLSSGCRPRCPLCGVAVAGGGGAEAVRARKKARLRARGGGGGGGGGRAAADEMLLPQLPGPDDAGGRDACYQTIAAVDAPREAGAPRLYEFIEHDVARFARPTAGGPAD